jgi:hypothetical protein
MQPGQWHLTMPTYDGKHLSSSMYFIKLIDFIDQKLIWRLRKCISHFSIRDIEMSCLYTLRKVDEPQQYKPISTVSGD